MKKHLSLLLAAAFAVFASVGCDEKLPSAPETPQAEKLALNLRADVVQFTKATDTGFDAGDAVGVSIVVPEWAEHNASLYAHNVPFSISADGTMSSEFPLYWYDDVDQSGYVMSYYPYSTSYRMDDEWEFTVKKDQSYHEAYTSSDLMFACTEAKPTKEAVKLTYNHLLSKVVVYVDNKLDDAVSDVFISDVYGSVKVDVDTEAPVRYAVTGTKDVIRMCPAKDASGRSVWAAITVPQTSVSPKLVVTTASKKQYTYVLTDSVTFRAGTRNTAEIVLDDSSISTAFTPEVSDWLPGDDLDFGQISDPADWQNYHYSSEGDFEFLKWLVDNRAYGDATPTLADLRACNFEGFTGIYFGQDWDGKWFIGEIYFFASGETPSSNLFNAFPPTIDLPNLEQIFINCAAADGTDPSTMTEWMKCPLAGSELPTTWNCPKLWRLHLECVGMQGVISPSLAALPALEQLFIRCCDVYGALPHEWKSDVLNWLVIGFGGQEADCPNMGYIVPATFDVILNSERGEDPRLRDKTGINIAGAAGNWLGYENGWGQKRYERFDPEAKEGNLTVWSDFRGLTQYTSTDVTEQEAEIAPGGLRNPNCADNMWYVDSWPWYYWRANPVPKCCVEWNQAEADAFTAEMAARPRIFTRAQ